MAENTRDDESRKSDIGSNVALGLSFGFIFGLLIFDGNIALGMGLGLCIGLIIGAISDFRKKDQSR